MLRLAPLVLLALAGCHRPLDLSGTPGVLEGAVRSWGTMSPVAGAKVELVQWPSVYGSGVVATGWAAFEARTEPDGSFAFDPFDDGRVYDPGRAVPFGRTRIKVTAPGYEPAIFYRDLTYGDDCRVDFGRGRGSEVGCEYWDLDLIPSDRVQVDLLPDVMVDEGAIADCSLEDTGSQQRLRVSVGTPNAGRGPVELRSVVGSNEVRQVVHTRAGDTYELPLRDAAFLWNGHEDHDHFHFENWTHIRILDPDSGFMLGVGNKVSFCLIDLSGFDDEIYDTVWGQGGSYGCGVDQGEILQGLSPGRMDVYSKGLEGQYVDITDLDPGHYVLEVEVDPNGYLFETTTDNNRAQVLVTLPDEPVGPGYNPCQPLYLQDAGW